MRIVLGGASPRIRNIPLAWRCAWAVLALAYAWPLGTTAYEALMEVNEQARTGLIVQHRLWELQPDFRGQPEAWTRIASRVLTDRQLLRRVQQKYGAASEQIEIDYRRDLTVARAKAVATWLTLWALPLGLLYWALGYAFARPRAEPPSAPPPASVSDPRYRPPGQTT